MFSSGETCSAPLAANCIMFDGSLEARIKSIVRGMSSPPDLARNWFAKAAQIRSSFQLHDRKFQFSNEPGRLEPKKFLQQCPVIPESAIAPAVEARPNRFPDLAVVGENGPH